MTDDDYGSRHLAFEQCFNFRDIGGYETEDGKTVRWGRYFRAGRQDRMNAADLARLRALEVRTQIDLRAPAEIEDQSRGPLEELGARYVHVPVIPEGGAAELARIVGDTAISGRRYLGYLELGAETWIRLFDLFADPRNQPFVVHCTAGKDRTGVTTALLLSVLGVERHTIVHDYLLTNRDVERQVDFVERAIGLPEGVDRPTLTRAAGVPDDAIRDFLDGLDRSHGGPLSFLKSIGIPVSTLESVRASFLEQSGV
ncbi:MAG: tyrosine-protein phosphatase [Acidobacteriota bacterium]